MKHTASALLLALALPGVSCTYNTYVRPPDPAPPPVVVKKTTPAPAPKPIKSASVSGSSPEGFEAVTKPSSYSQ